MSAPFVYTDLPGVWRASELGEQQLNTVGSGSDKLDRELPGSGWPRGSLTEILQAQSGLHEWRLLLPALRKAIANGPLVLIGSPHLPHLPALAAMGIAAAQVVLIEARSPAEHLWAAEQTLRCSHVGIVLMWLSQARTDQLRRLQSAGQSSASPLIFAFRPLSAQYESSPAPLRLSLRSGSCHTLSVQILKRRGPTMSTALDVQATLPPALTAAGRNPGRLPLPNYAVDRIRVTQRFNPTRPVISA